MVQITEGLHIDQTPIVRLESAWLQVDVVPGIGGRIASILNRPLGYQFLWHNSRLTLHPSAPGSAYEPAFYGGIDEMLPCDVPETINGLPGPDHGEVWTTALAPHCEGDTLVLSGRLPLWGLHYEKRLTLCPDAPIIELDYRMHNPTAARRDFMWKMHAALNIAPGDEIVCPARRAQVVDPRWSRWSTAEPFAWPMVQGQRADLVPAPDGTMDFLYLYDLAVGRLGWVRRAHGLAFTYAFDTRIFPYVQYFVTLGGLDGHYTAVLEPCTAMPLAVNDAARLGQCTTLGPGESLETHMSIYAGPLI